MQYERSVKPLILQVFASQRIVLHKPEIKFACKGSGVRVLSSPPRKGAPNKNWLDSWFVEKWIVAHFVAQFLELYEWNGARKSPGARKTRPRSDNSNTHRGVDRWDVAAAIVSKKFVNAAS